MLSYALFVLGYAAMAAVCGFAIFAGDRVTRWAGDVLALGWIATTAVSYYSPHSIHHPQYALTLLDAALVAIFAAMAFRYRRTWLIWLTSFQGLVAAADVAFILDPKLRSYAFMTLYVIWSYLDLAALAVGTWQARRTRASSA